MPAAPIRVLIADKSETSCQQTASQFAGRDGVTVVQVHDGAGVAAALQDDDIDIALIDAQTPRLDGRVVVEWATDRGRRGLLLLTASRLVDRWPAISAHVNAYDTLLKPIRRARVDTVLATYARLQTPGKALIVDSTVATSRLTGNLLRQSRFEFSIEETDSGRHAVRLTQLDRFDLALVALQNDDLSGLEVAAQLGEQPDAPHIILLGSPTDRAVMGQATLAMLGAHAYLRRPFAGHELDAAIHTAFGLWRPYLAKALGTAAEPLEA